MDYKQLFLDIMKEQGTISLATVEGTVPNVRIVNFVYDEKANKVYFATFQENEKVKEMMANPHVSFTTIPNQENTKHVKVKNAVVTIEKTPLSNYRELFVSKFPWYQDIINKAGDVMCVCSLPLHKVKVIADMEHAEMITL